MTHSNNVHDHKNFGFTKILRPKARIDTYKRQFTMPCKKIAWVEVNYSQVYFNINISCILKCNNN